MGQIDKTMKKVAEASQEKVKHYISNLMAQNQTIIENQNEMVDLMGKICDKLGIETEVEEVEQNDST